MGRIVGNFLARKIEYADIAQSAEHILGKDEVTRSNRVISSRKNPVNITFPGFYIFIERLYYHKKGNLLWANARIAHNK